MRLLLLVLAACSPPNVRIPGDSEPDGDSDPYDSEPAADGCAPTAALASPFFTEGDAVSFSFECGSGARRQDFFAEVVNLPAEAAFEAETWSFSWTPRFDQGARYDLMLVVRPRGDAGAFPETAVATFWVADAVGDSRNQPVDAKTYTEEWGLPVFHLDPHASLGETDIPATFTVYGHTYDGEMKVRGAVSVGYPKQSYTLTFSGPDDLDADRWGMGEKDHLYAISPFDDNSYTRQWLAYQTWAAIAEHWGEQRLALRTFFAVVYLSGAYHGLYLMCDRPDDHFAQEMGFSRGGNLYKSYDHDANFYRTDAYGGAKNTLHDGYDKKEGADLSDWSDLDALVAFSADHDHDAFWAEAGAWIDVPEFMDWFLFVHWLVAEDSAGKNAYLYNDPAAPLFRFCPWDFNHAFGQGWYTYRVGATTYDDFIGTNGIFAHFQGQVEASAELWGRMAALQAEGPLRNEWLRDRLDEAYALIDRSATRDWSVWGPSFSSYWGASNRNDYEQEKAYLYDWIADRAAYMRSVHD